ncbi:MAG: hypothetical protein U0R70_02780 [Solirubrobacteraceae bacterium]
MSALDRVFPKVPDGAPRRQGWRRATGPGQAPAAPAAGAPLPPGGGAAVAPDDLLARRQALAQRLAKLQWDLGGLAYEMAIRDHFRPDVLVRQAARLQQVDAELGEVERMLRMEEAGAAGACPHCGALHSRGAVFCWQCGLQLMGTTGGAGPALDAAVAGRAPDAATPADGPPPADLAPHRARPAPPSGPFTSGDPLGGSPPG